MYVDSIKDYPLSEYELILWSVRNYETLCIQSYLFFMMNGMLSIKAVKHIKTIVIDRMKSVGRQQWFAITVGRQ